MDRKEYLEWCRECAVLPQGLFGVRQNVPESRKVVFGGIPYYPQGYLLEFDANGQAVHTAVLHDLVAHAVVRCPLDKVGKYLEERTENDENYDD